MFFKLCFKKSCCGFFRCWGDKNSVFFACFLTFSFLNNMFQKEKIALHARSCSFSVVFGSFFCTIVLNRRNPSILVKEFWRIKDKATIQNGKNGGEIYQKNEKYLRFIIDALQQKSNEIQTSLAITEFNPWQWFGHLNARRSNLIEGFILLSQFEAGLELHRNESQVPGANERMFANNQLNWCLSGRVNCAAL